MRLKVRLQSDLLTVPANDDVLYISKAQLHIFPLIGPVKVVEMNAKSSKLSNILKNICKNLAFLAATITKIKF